MKAAMTSGTMSAAGDLLAQFLTGEQAKVRMVVLLIAQPPYNTMLA
jgi:hypothetical protein